MVMRVFVAGGSGVMGRRLVPQLVLAGVLPGRRPAYWLVPGGVLPVASPGAGWTATGVPSTLADPGGL